MVKRGTGGQRGKDSIRDSAAWKGLLSERDPPKLLARFDAVIGQLSAADVDVLLAIAASADAHERQRALAVLGKLAQGRDARLGEPQRKDVIRELARAAEAEYPRNILGSTAFTYLHATEPALAQKTLTQVNVHELDDTQREEVVRALTRYVSPAAETGLRQLMDLGGRAGAAARSVLEGRNLLGVEAIEGLADRWRKTRSPDLLHELYLRYVTNQVGMGKVADLVKLLGPPDRREGKAVWYMPNRDTALFMEGDATGVLRAVKFT